MRTVCLLLLAAWLAAWAPFAPPADPAGERERMVREIERYAARISLYPGKDTLSAKVLQAMARVPRHEFVPEDRRHLAYENRPLPIGYGQTISQPYIVAVMTDLLNIKPGDRVLEVGTGSGYQAAVLASLSARVYTLEIIPELAASARTALARTGAENVTVVTGDGYYGLPDQAPFDAVIVTAAASHIPPPLVEQLASSGRMVIPVGGAFMTQELLLVTKGPGGLDIRSVLPVAFVPLTGGH